MKLTSYINHKIYQWFGISFIKHFPRYSEIMINSLLGKDKPLVGAEVGVYEGDNALRLLQKTNTIRIYLIDNYNNDESEIWNYDIQKAKETAHKKMNKMKYTDVVWIEKKSHKCINDIPDGLDYVYIDASHDYFNVLRDLNLYYTKLRKGGLLMGHDLIIYDVARAVHDFSNKLNLPVITKIGENDWVIVKR